MATLSRPGLCVAALCATSLLAACASTKVDTQWADPQFTGTSLRGARVLVACDAYDIGLKHLCEEQLASELTARGASAVVAAPAPAVPTPSPADVRQQAQAANAQAALSVRVGYADARAAPGVSIGIGGFGIGGGSTRAGVGVGVAVPVGGGSANGHTARGSVIDASSGRTMWTFTVTTPPSSDYGSQMGEMARAVGSAAQDAGLLPK